MASKAQTLRGIPIHRAFPCLAALLMFAGQFIAKAAPLPGLRPVPTFAPEPEQLARLQRTLTVLNSATPAQRHRFRIIVYGQSISLQPWWVTVATELRKRFPNVDFAIENRAIAGFEAEELIETVVPDVIDARPDLVILHSYGFEAGMERLLRKLHDGTTADVMIQRDHPLLSVDLVEPTDPESLTEANWWAYRNYVWLPRQCTRYGFCLADIRGFFKGYIGANRLRVNDLLTDATHPNTEGNLLIAEAILRYLTAPPVRDAFEPDNNPKIRTLSLDPESTLAGNILEVDFAGTRVDVLLKKPFAGAYRVTIDGIAPSAWPALTRFSRTSSCLGVAWPAIMTLGPATNLVEEEWTLTLLEVVGRAQEFRFRLVGSRTGFDGEGSNTNVFRSNSGRISITPNSWWIPFAARHSQITPIPGFQVTWQSVLHGTDRIQPSDESDDVETSITMADGLPEGRHRLRLELEQPGTSRIRGIRAYSPSGSAAVGRFDWPLPKLVDGLQMFRLSTGPILAWPRTLTVQAVEWTERPDDPGSWRPLTVPWQNVGDATLAIPGLAPRMRFYRLRL